jgi:hypothetical protein
MSLGNGIPLFRRIRAKNAIGTPIIRRSVEKNGKTDLKEIATRPDTIAGKKKLRISMISKFLQHSKNTMMHIMGTILYF